MATKYISVKSSAGTYSVVCGSGVLRRAMKKITKLGKFSSVHVVSSPKVWRAAGKSIKRALGAGKSSEIHLMNDAESVKNLRTMEVVSRALVKSGADRRSLLVAVGGGVVGDVAGFVAASYLRGIALVHVPTTVVAQVDSAIGGKTGVNLPEGKNLVGAFYPPKGVVADPGLLSSLPPRDFRSGIYEIIKYGVIGDAKLFQFLEGKLEKVLRRERAALAFVIERSIAQKARVVSEDEHESGLREILNFGHTSAPAP